MSCEIKGVILEDDQNSKKSVLDTSINEMKSKIDEMKKNSEQSVKKQIDPKKKSLKNLKYIRFMIILCMFL
jgi:hypothetical protein